MKEMTIEQKARAYNEALERAKKYWNSPRTCVDIDVIPEFFPELREDKDEEIRKALINVFATHKDYEMFFGVSVEEILSWLEKQGEKKTTKIEVNTEELSDFERSLKHIIEEAIEDGDTHNLKADADLLLRIARKTSWSEEDEKNLRRAIRATKVVYPETADWPKSLKDRVQPQNNIVTDKELAQAKKDAYNDALDKIEYHSGEPTFDDGWNAAIWYLKKRNDRPQSHWTPSDAQIQALKEACDKSWEPDGLDPLYTLYKDLKKLKGE